VTDFLDSMPAAYARAFRVSEVQEHENIVSRRGARLAYAEVCAGPNGELVCVVADDRPGLLALVTDALLVHGLSVKGAQVYCRRPAGGEPEAVDFFELRQSSEAAAEVDIGASDLAAFVQTLSELIAEDILAASRPSAIPSSGRASTRVYFELEALRQGEFVLLIEAPDSSGLLNAITSALHAQGVRILASEIRTEEGVARDRFDIASPDAEALNAIRLCDIQLAVHAAVLAVSQRR
jgi:UTP:GlnB (protein PII) uridylyltransferase